PTTGAGCPRGLNPHRIGTAGDSCAALIAVHADRRSVIEPVSGHRDRCVPVGRCPPVDSACGVHCRVDGPPATSTAPAASTASAASTANRRVVCRDFPCDLVMAGCGGME